MTKRLLPVFVLALALVTVASPLSFARAESEVTSSLRFVGQLIELSSTDAPTTIIVREDPTGTWTDYTVDITSATTFGTWTGNTTVMSDWITGDNLSISGTLNENTGVVTALTVVNLSLQPFKDKGVNGWITAIDLTASTMTVQWNDELKTIHVTADTHMVIPPLNPATLADFMLGDRVRARLSIDSPDARIIVALRRGSEIFLKARTRGFSSTLNEISDNGDGTGSLGVTLVANAHLREGDVNNLIGTEGDQLTVTYDADTKFVRKHSGQITVETLLEGDALFVVGRMNDDGTISARLIKDISVDGSVTTFSDEDADGTAEESADVDIVDDGSVDVSEDVTITRGAGPSRVSGKITALDTDANTLMVMPATGSSAVTVSYTDETTIEVNDEASDETAFVVGQVIHVQGTGTLSPRAINASEITIRTRFEIITRPAPDLDTNEEASEDEATEEEVAEDAADDAAEESAEDAEDEAEFDVQSNETAI